MTRVVSADRPVCPECGKATFTSRRAALRSARHIANATGGGRAMRAYKSCGGAWHVSSSSGDKLARRQARAKTANRRAG